MGPFIYYVSTCKGEGSGVRKYQFLLIFSKDKSPEVPFHRITSSYSYFEEFEFLRQFSKKQNTIKKKYQLNRNEKFVDKAQQCFAFLQIKLKFKFSCFLEMYLVNLRPFSTSEMISSLFVFLCNYTWHPFFKKVSHVKFHNKR